MKKILITLLVFLAAIFSLAGCAFGSNGDTNGSSFVGDTEQSEHIHDFVVYETKKAYCGKDGYQKLKCQCGEKIEEVIPKLGHDVQYYSTTPATCIKPGAVTHKCTRCSYQEVEETPVLGHEMSEFVEASRLTYCTRKGCNHTELAQGN
jgi:hypothetical protein